jgi:hypothetical protein
MGVPPGPRQASVPVARQPIAWYGRRALRMSPAELIHRGADAARKVVWRRRRRAVGLRAAIEASSRDALSFRRVPRRAAQLLSEAARLNLLAAADGLLDGKWAVFGHLVDKFGRDIDWFRDPKTGRRYAERCYCFSVPYRDERLVGNVKFLWEMSRHHHLTVLAAAYWLSGDRRYAERVADHLSSWWRANPFLNGVHWCSGIELGIRLISWVWIRRLLADWRDVALLFECNGEFAAQLYWHQEFLAAFRSRDSSANNHLIAEAAGQFVASTAFPLFDASHVWRSTSAQLLEREVVRQTDRDGLNRELATDYHGFVLELLLAAGVEGDAADLGLSDEFWARVQAMMDALASIVDCTTRPPRQGDSDDGIALLLDAPEADRWTSLLATGGRLFGQLAWWPDVEEGDVRTAFLSVLAKPRLALGQRPDRKIASFAESGVVVLHDQAPGRPELWCRCDHGPHGFLSIAAHAHADALAIELRHGGVDVFADPGTYCYHGEENWRRYFRSTLGHNTLELGGLDQAIAGGPFLWLRHPASRLDVLAGAGEGPTAVWSASHDGYRSSLGAIVHRAVTLRRGAGLVVIEDWIEGPAGQSATLPFHLGPTIACRLNGHLARLEWSIQRRTVTATLSLPDQLTWTTHVGDHIAGWYSPGFARKCPSVTLIGHGRLEPGQRMTTRLLIADAHAATVPDRAIDRHLEATFLSGTS